MRSEWKYRLYGIMLLMVILPVIIAVPFHHHALPASAEISCESCVHHLPHSGHLSGTVVISDCVACQLLGAAFLSVKTLLVTAFSVLMRSLAAPLRLQRHSAVCISSSTRAPPFSFCF